MAHDMRQICGPVLAPRGRTRAAEELWATGLWACTGPRFLFLSEKRLFFFVLKQKYKQINYVLTWCKMLACAARSLLQLEAFFCSFSNKLKWSVFKTYS
jgi:hypothetical protein